MKRKIERVIRREFSIEIRKKEEEIELINQVYIYMKKSFHSEELSCRLF